MAVISEKECDLRHEPITQFMQDWNSRWNGILLSIIAGLLMLVGNLALNLWKTTTVNFTSQAQAQSQELNK